MGERVEGGEKRGGGVKVGVEGPPFMDPPPE